MFCGKFAEFNTRHPERNKVHYVTILPMRDKLQECCGKKGDAWGSEVLHSCVDLVAAEAIYHVNCYS